MRASVPSTWACACSTSASVVMPSFRRSAMRRSVKRNCASRTSFSVTALRADSTCATASASAARGGRVVEPREHLALRDSHAFLHVHLDDLAGNLRRHGRAAPRRDIARRVQHRRLRPGRALGNLGDLDGDWPLARHPHPDASTRACDQDEREDPPEPAPRAGTFGLALDAQRVQILFQISHSDRFVLIRRHPARRRSDRPGRTSSTPA